MIKPRKSCIFSKLIYFHIEMQCCWWSFMLLKSFSFVHKFCLNYISEIQLEQNTKKSRKSRKSFWLLPKLVILLNLEYLMLPLAPENQKLTAFSYHLTYAFQSGSTLYSCLNVKELLAWSRREIWILSDCNWTWTQNRLVRKRTFNHLANLFSIY